MAMESNIDKYVNSQKNWITKTYARSQLMTVHKNRNEWITDRSVLDIGCGRGVLEATFRELAKDFTSCDLEDQNMFDLIVTVCSADDLPFGDEKYDTIFLLGVIEHLPDPETAAGEFLRVLKPGGLLITTIPNGLLWSTFRLMKPVLSEHLIEHAVYNEKELLQTMNRFEMKQKINITPFIYDLYLFQKPQN